jgi:hypothetical protein
VFEKRVLSITSEPKRDEVTGGWRKLHNEFHNLYSLPYIIITVVKSRRMRQVRHVAHTIEKRNVYKILVGKHEGKNNMGDLGIDGRILK